VRELRQLDLELAFGAARALGEDVEDERGAVDHLDAERLAEVALLDRRERIVGDEQIDAARARGLGHFLDLAAAGVERPPRRRPPPRPRRRSTATPARGQTRSTAAARSAACRAA